MAPPTPPLIATTAQRRRQLLLQHRFNEAADAAAQTRFDRVEPGVARKQPLGALSCRAILAHGVVSSRRANAGLWLSSLNRRLRHPFSNHIPDCTSLRVAGASLPDMKMMQAVPYQHTVN